MRAWISLLGLGAVVLTPFGCETKGTNDNADGAPTGTGGVTSEYVPLEPGAHLKQTCQAEPDGVTDVIVTSSCFIGRYGVLAEVYTENSTLRVFVEDNQLGLFPANESTRSSVRIGLPCQGGTIHERTPCTIELAEYTRAENPVDGMAGASGTAVEVGSAVTMLVDCPEGLSIDRGDDWSPLPVSLEPKKFSIHAEDCEVTW